MNLSKCKKCKATLIDGPNQDRRAEKDSIAVEVENIPTKVCPHGCPGYYWYWLDFGVEVIDCRRPESANIAKRKGFFKTHHLCKKCNTEIENTNETSKFIFTKTLKNGKELTLKVSGPAMSCPQCQSRFLPAQGSSHDAFYVILGDAISAALTDDLIYK